MTRLILLPLVVLLTACREPDTIGPPPDPKQLEYAPELNIDFDAMMRTESGLYFQDVRIGDGEAVVSGDTVEVLYSGWLPNGTLLEARHDPDAAAQFVLGDGSVIPGWEEGIRGMRVGGVRRLVVPPGLAYGRHGRRPVPPNATLVFEIELVSAGS